MGLDYSAQALTVIIVFVNWALVIDWLRTWRERRRGGRAGAQGVLP